MNPIVLDASVFAKMFFEEAHSAQVRRIVSKARELIAPDLILAEVANVIWKRHARREVDDAEAAVVVREILRFPIRLIPTTVLLSDAFSIALDCQRSVYDSLYLAAAIQHHATLITADRRFARAIAATASAQFVHLIGE